jgi:E3 UFM1-protein ligase 1
LLNRRYYRYSYEYRTRSNNVEELYDRATTLTIDDVDLDTAAVPTMSDDVEDVSTEPPMHLAEKDALALMEILMMRGYFHEKVSPSDGSLRTYRKEDALLIETVNSCYITISELRKRFIDLVLLYGRMTILESVEPLKVSSGTLQRHVVPWIVGLDSSEEFIVVSSPNGSTKEVVSAAYIFDKIESLRSIMLDTAENGVMLVSDVAASFHLPSDITLTLLEKRIDARRDSDEIHILLTDNAASALVTGDYLNFVRTKLSSLLNNDVDAPISIKSLAKTNKWEVGWVLQMIKKGGFDVQGEFHGDMFVPNSFIENQRRLVGLSYSMNGFVSSHMCHAMYGISTSQMKAYATHDKMRESYVLLPNSVVNVDVVVAPLIEAVRLAVESTSWLDLKLHLPMDLLVNETTDARILVESRVLNDDVSGIVCICSDGALFFSEPMVKAFTDEHLKLLINEMAISRAIELLRMAEPDVPSVAYDSIDVNGSNRMSSLTGKEKRKGRKSGKDSSPEDVFISSDDIGEFPIDGIVEALFELYPDLSHLESSSDVLRATCQKAFFTDDLESLWNASVRRELQLRVSDKKSVSGSIGQCVVAACGYKSIEIAFEDPGCFATSCYLIQAKAKFVLYALQFSDRISDEMKHQLKLDFLDTCCLDFVYRITRYALFKKNVEDGIFQFGPAECGTSTFYDPVDLVSSSYPKIFLSCLSKRNDALAILQEELPAGVGSALAKLWTLCGEAHFQRDKTRTDKNLSKIDAGVESVECFLSNARENCLIICGLPFATFDKKAEKKFLNSRRIRLVQLFDNANDISTALDFAIMILYQDCKNMVVSGTLLRGPVINLLSHERKVPEALSTELLSLTEKVERGEHVDLSAVVRLKELMASSAKGAL